MFVFAGASGLSVIAMKLLEEIYGRFTLGLSWKYTYPDKRIYGASFLRSFCFSQISEALRKLLYSSVEFQMFSA